jgi:hypothetical protein
VVAAIYFDDEVGAGGEEVNDETPERHLAAEVDAEAMATDVGPEGCFGGREVGAMLASRLGRSMPRTWHQLLGVIRSRLARRGRRRHGVSMSSSAVRSKTSGRFERRPLSRLQRVVAQS